MTDVTIKIDNEGSKAYSLNKTDLKKIGKGALIAVGGALLTYLTSVIGNLDLGNQWTPIVVAIGSILINAAWKFIQDNS